MTTPALNPDSRADYYPLAAAICVFLVALLRCAWLSDDAFITFRTVENLWNGYGLTWNAGERVQTFTHPLWMFLLAGVYGVTREFYFSVIALSVLLTLGAVWLLVRRVADGALNALLGVTLFACSKAFVDFSTSGLENPLTHLLLLAFLYLALRKPDDRRTFARLTFLAALLLLTRMDLALLVLPELAVRFYRRFDWRTVGGSLLAFSPFVLWVLFAIFYYGSPFPNTAYAKLNHDLPAGATIGYGLHYLLATLTEDPLTLVVLLVSWSIPFLSKERRLIPLALGSALYVIYTVKIGGDFMLGRFLTAPFLVGVALLTYVRLSRRTAYALLLIALVAGVAMRRSSLLSDVEYGRDVEWFDDRGVCDERAFYYHGTGLLRLPINHGEIQFRFASAGRSLREQNIPVSVTSVVGMLGYFAGPSVYVIDVMALSDPLLARLKPLPDKKWRPGHLARGIPAGYQDTLASGRNRIKTPELAEYYNHIRLVTRGPLWDTQRLRTIWALNLGEYDHLLDAASITYERPVDSFEISGESPVWNAPGVEPDAVDAKSELKLDEP